MTWLALAAWQAWTLAVVVAGAITWLFLRKLRHPRRAVPSLILWQRALERERPRRTAERLRWLISLLVTVAVVLLLALAPGRPALMPAGARPRLIALVIDTAPSMATRTASGRTRLDRATARARALVAAAGPAARVRLADTAGRVNVPASAARADLVHALDRMATWPGPDHLPALADDEEAIILTDGVRRRRWPPRAERLSVFETAANVGIAAFDIRPVPARPSAYEAYVEVVNASRDRRRAELSIRDSSGLRVRRALDLASRERVRDAFDVSGFTAGPVKATVASVGDSFAPDDAAVAYLPSHRRIRTLLVTSGNGPLETALGLDPLVELTTARALDAAATDAADVCVFDRVAPPDEPRKPALLFRPPDVAWLGATVRVVGDLAHPAVTLWDRAHPVLQLVNSRDVRIDQSEKLEITSKAPGVTVAASAGSAPLVVVVDRSPRRVIVGFGLQDTDFPFQLGFPLFLRNALEWLTGAREPLRVNSGLVSAPWSDAAIATEAGVAVTSRRVLASTVFEAAEPALLVATRGGERIPIVVGPPDASWSNVNDSEFDGPSRDEGAQPARAGEVWPIMLGLAFALVALEWVTFHRRLTL